MSEFASEFIRGESRRSHVAAVVYGIDPIPGQLDNAIGTLVNRGYDVATYTYGGGVILDGEAERLPQLIDDIRDDFAEKSETYGQVRTVGASLGSFIAFNIQRRLEETETGLYAVAGVTLAWNISHHPFYRPTWKRYQANGHTPESLAAAWRNVDVVADRPPTASTGLKLLLTRLDQYVPYCRARHNAESWQEQGVPLELIKTWRLGHTAAIAAFDKGFAELL